MDEKTHTPDESPVPSARVPDPHRTEPAPPAEEGMRPGADPAVRPEQDEPFGPAAGLVSAAGAEVEAEASDLSGDRDPEAEALLAKMGVEEEGIESGQLLGLVAATIAAVIALAVILIYLFYIPFRTQVGTEAEGLARTTELDIVRTEGLAKLEQYARTDETYAVPIDRAMAIVASQYGTDGAAAGLPTTRADWNTVSVMRGPGRAVQVPTQRGALTAPVPETGVDAGPLDPSGIEGGTQEALRRTTPVLGGTGEEVGVDEPGPDDN